MKKIIARLLWMILGLFLAIVLLVAIAFRVANRTNGTIISAGEKRTYLLYVPGSYDPSRPAPLVVTIHGFAQWPAHQMQITHWNDLADEYGFIVVYPAGTGFPLRWRIVGGSSSEGNPMQDVTFISDLISQLEAEYNIDPTRIYANGLSNGGGMSFQWPAPSHFPGRTASLPARCRPLSFTGRMIRSFHIMAARTNDLTCHFPTSPVGLQRLAGVMDVRKLHLRYLPGAK